MRACERSSEGEGGKGSTTNDAHLPRDGSAAPCPSDASVPSTQAAFTDSHHVVYLHLIDADDLPKARAQLCVKAPFLLSQK